MSEDNKTQAIRTSLFGEELKIKSTKEEVLEEIQKLPEKSAILMAIRGPNIGAKYLLDKPVTTIGRNEKSDIFLDDSTVSRNHSIISRIDDSFIISDSKSLNGTYVNLENVIGERELKNEDIVNIGRFQLTFFKK